VVKEHENLLTFSTALSVKVFKKHLQEIKSSLDKVLREKKKKHLTTNKQKIIVKSTGKRN